MFYLILVISLSVVWVGLVIANAIVKHKKKKLENKEEE